MNCTPLVIRLQDEKIISIERVGLFPDIFDAEEAMIKHRQNDGFSVYHMTENTNGVEIYKTPIREKDGRQNLYLIPYQLS